MEQLVTKDKLKDWVTKDAVTVVGRALVALFNRQEDAEKSGNSTISKNGIGFSANDARLGSIGAKYYIQFKTLTPKLLAGWLKESNGYPRICRYSKQLNEVANEKYRSKMLKRLDDQIENAMRDEYEGDFHR
jgi:hypothetical protein